MIILGIDTSCDDTCIALLEIRNWKPSTRVKLGAGLVPHRNEVSGAGLEILSNIVSSQVKLHAKYGGVYPSLAKREHQKNLPLVFKKALQFAKPDLIAVTNGPGLEPCLWQGINFAKGLAKQFKKPLIPVNHLEAHIFSNWLEHKNILMPAVCLVVSGGHTQLILMKKIGQYKILGETRDDAAGECFDKVARILGLGYPGGPKIAAEAAKYKIQNTRYKIQLPRPMIHQKNYDFSFSGLKTAVLYKCKSQNSKLPWPYGRGKSQNFVRAMSYEVQQAIIDVLIYKTLKAAKDYRAKSIILGGGVAANTELRKQLKEKTKKEIPNTKYYIPDTKFCTDNAAMIGMTAFFHCSKSSKDIKAEANLKI